MKWLLYLLPLYILLLSCIPCNADDGCCPEEINAATTQHNESFPSQKPALPCSPFFACGACHGFIIPELVLPVIKPILDARKQTPPFMEHYLGGYTLSTWQPPRQA